MVRRKREGHSLLIANRTAFSFLTIKARYLRRRTEVVIGSGRPVERTETADRSRAKAHFSHPAFVNRYGFIKRPSLLSLRVWPFTRHPVLLFFLVRLLVLVVINLGICSTGLATSSSTGAIGVKWPRRAPFASSRLNYSKRHAAFYQFVSPPRTDRHQPRDLSGVVPFFGHILA